jgi:hypothetical protein
MSDSGNDLFNAVQDWVAHELRGERPSSRDYPPEWHESRRSRQRDPRGDLTAIGQTSMCD